MNDFDTIIRAGSIVTGEGVISADVGIGGARISALEGGLSGSGREEISAAGLYVFPGLIDAHVHFNEPGRAHWEGLETGSRALAAGGGTLFFDMPLNAHPPTIDRESFRLKLEAAQARSLVDFAFWGGLVPGNLDRLEELADCGVVGFKAFMCNSGIEDFPHADDRTLREGMKRAARLGLPVAVHAESEVETRRRAQQSLAEGRTEVRDYLDSRPVVAELDAIKRALELAGETGCALHVVHVSCGSGVRLVADARKLGLDVSCETCPHYLTLTNQDMERIGAVAKCAPPLRSKTEQAALWDALLGGEIDTLGSDHSPSPPEMKQDKNFFKVWGGISSVQHTLPLLLTSSSLFTSSDGRSDQGENENANDEGRYGTPVLSSPGGAAAANSVPLIAGVLSERVARRFKLPQTKGRLAVGGDADLALVDLGQTFEVRKEELLYRHQQSPYLGRRLRGRIVQTFLRGHRVFRDGKTVSKPLGQLVKPVK
jgi:allantoinase